MDDGFAFMFILIIALLIIGAVICITLGIIDWVCSDALEDAVIECVITHMDIDNGTKLITVLSVDGTLAQTITVTAEEYAKCNVGDTCAILRTGFHSPLRGDVFEYKLYTEEV